MVAVICPHFITDQWIDQLSEAGGKSVHGRGQRTRKAEDWSGERRTALVQARGREVITAKQSQLRVHDVIHADAVGIKRGMIRKARIKSRESSGESVAVAIWKRIQIWTHRGGDLRS